MRFPSTQNGPHHRGRAGAGTQNDDTAGGGGNFGMRSGVRAGGRKPSFKTRGGSTGHPRNIRATKVTLPASKVRELASKFNAVIVDERESERGPSKTITASSKTSSSASSSVVFPPSSAVLAAIQRFEGIIVDHHKSSKPPHERPKCLLVRTNSAVNMEPLDRLRKIPEAVPEEQNKEPLPKDSATNATTEGTSQEIKRLEKVVLASPTLSNVAAEENAPRLANEQPRTGSENAGKKIANEKPKIKPKPSSLSRHRRPLSATSHEIPYKQNYSINNNRLSLPKVPILEELLSDEDTTSKSKKPNNSFLWSAKNEAVETFAGTNAESVEMMNAANESVPDEIPHLPLRPQHITTAQSTPNLFVDSVTAELTNLIANKSSLYRHLGGSHDAVTSLKHSDDNAARFDKTKENLEPNRRSSVESSGSPPRLPPLEIRHGLEESSRPQVHKETPSPNHRVAFYLLPNQIIQKEKGDSDSEGTKQRVERSSSIRSQASYEDVAVYKQYEDMEENNYADIADYDDNEAIYDDVLNVISSSATEGIYETIYSGELPRKEDSDSSADHQNSLYDHRPASQASSSGSGGRRSAGSKSDGSDEWMDIEPEDKDRREEFILLEDKTKPKNIQDSWSQRVRRQWSHRLAEEFKKSRVISARILVRSGSDLAPPLPPCRSPQRRPPPRKQPPPVRSPPPPPPTRSPPAAPISVDAAASARPRGPPPPPSVQRTASTSSSSTASSSQHTQRRRRHINNEVAISSPSKVCISGPDSEFRRPPTEEEPKSTKGLVSLRDVIYFGEKYEDQEVTIHLKGEGEANDEVYESTTYDGSAILDDFEDSSDSEFGDKSGTFELVPLPTSPTDYVTNQQSGSGRESEGIYGLMMSAGKKVKKTSWSFSQRLRRRMSKISISVSETIVSEGGVEPGNQKRWPSFKRKTKLGTSKFYVDPEPNLPRPDTAAQTQTNGQPSLPFVLPPFKESKRPSLDLPQPPSPAVPPSVATQSPILQSLPLVLPPFNKETRGKSPPLRPQTSPSSDKPSLNSTDSGSESRRTSVIDSRRSSMALPSGRPTSPPPPPPPPPTLVNGESKTAQRSVNDPTLYVESGLFGSNQTTTHSIIANQTNHSAIETNSNHSGSSGRSHSSSQWYSDVGLYENTTSEADSLYPRSSLLKGKTKRNLLEPLPDLPTVRQISNSSWYFNLNTDSRYAPSESDSDPDSRLDLQFADEPLYQFYAARVAELEQSENNSDIGYEEIGTNSESSGHETYSPSNVSIENGGNENVRPSALDLVNHESLHRTLWCQVPQVINSGILESLTVNHKRLQEAKFELITSEASYYKSLTVLEKVFTNSPTFKDESVIPKVDYKTLFGNVNPVRKCSEALLAGLEKCWQDSILLDGICDVILDVAKSKFSAYVRYCSHQVAIERTLKRLKKNPVFFEKLSALESSPACHSLSLSSFLLLPMQRITRLPLLIDAIMTKLGTDSPEYESCQIVLLALNKVVHDCNEAARQTERLEEMVALSRALVFPKHLRPLPLMSASRWLIRSGQVVQFNPDTKLTFSKKLTVPRQTKLTLFLFNDLFFVTKKKSEESFNVITYCPRNFVQMSAMDDPMAVPGTNPTRFLLSITILENHNGKTQELMVSCYSESCRQRWLQPFVRPTSEDPDQVLYETWDCPQVVASHAYPSSQPDELSLQPGDVVNVLTKMADGWFYGERLRDSEKGWFPGNHVTEVASAHVRARNLKLRHRLLALSSSLIQQRQMLQQQP